MSRADSSIPDDWGYSIPFILLRAAEAAGLAGPGDIQHGGSISRRRLQNADSNVRLYLEKDETGLRKQLTRMQQKERQERRITHKEKDGLER